MHTRFTVNRYVDGFEKGAITFEDAILSPFVTALWWEGDELIEIEGLGNSQIREIVKDIVCAGKEEYILALFQYWEKGYKGKIDLYLELKNPKSIKWLEKALNAMTNNSVEFFDKYADD